MTGRWLLAPMWLLWASTSALAQGSAQADARGEVAAALYAASATRAALERLADTGIHAQRSAIEGLRAGAGEARGRATLAAAQERLVAALIERDRAYAPEIALFRAAVQDIAATPEGAAALARFNGGDEAGALAVLDDLRKARGAARPKRSDIESAAEARRVAMLAQEARLRGKQTTEQVIARYEEVTQLDLGVNRDWVELGRLYWEADKLAEALRAAKGAAATARDDREGAVALEALAEVRSAQRDGAGALAAYRKAFDLRQTLAAREPADTEVQRDLAMTLAKVGNVLRAQGDGAGALVALRRSLAMSEALAARDPANNEWQRDLLLGHIKVGDILRARGDGPGALAAYRSSLAIGEALAARGPSNADWQRDLVVSYVKLSEATGERSYAVRALDTALSMQQRGILAPRDAWMIEELKKRAGR